MSAPGPENLAAADSVAKGVGPSNEHEKALDFANYFSSYGYLYHQKDMLQDIIRMESYRTAILQNKKCFEGKAVLDVGTGSGVLAIWAAMAGARVVYAVEATSMAKQARRLAEANGVGHIVQVFEGYMEQVELPEKVDVLVSEWMGYFLLRESMLDPVINARQRWLKPGGACYPSQASLFMAPLQSSLYHPRLQEFEREIAGWSSFKHFMTEENELELDCLDADWHKEQRDYLLHSCMWQQINPSEIIGTSTTLLEFDVGSVTQADIATFTTPFRMEITADAEVSGFGSWFDTAFEGSEASPASHPVLLTTEPPSETHWGQQVLLLHPPQPAMAGDVLHGEITLGRQPENHRLLWLRMTLRHTRPMTGEQVYPERTINYRVD